MRHTTVIMTLMTLVTSSLPAHAGPTTSAYEGRLLIPGGGAAAPGPYQMSFALYDARSAGNPIWSVASPLEVNVLEGGRFTALLDFARGETSPGSLASPDWWLEITVDGETLTPRQRIVAPPGAAVLSALEAKSGMCPRGYYQETDPTDTNNGAWTVCKRTVVGEVDEMVKVGDSWIDRYEAWVCAGDLGCDPGYDVDGTGTCIPRGGVSKTTASIACSTAGRGPTVRATWFQAAQMCANAGKRLCTNAEWQTAVSGTPDPGDGVTIPGGRAALDACNVASNPGRVPNASASGRPANTGAHADCVSRFGAYDMIGNVSEWIADWWEAGPQWTTTDGAPAPTHAGSGGGPWPPGYGDDMTLNLDGQAFSGSQWTPGLPAAGLRGGHWDIGTDAGAFALHLDSGPSLVSTNIGARCCAGGP